MVGIDGIRPQGAGANLDPRAQAGTQPQTGAFRGEQVSLVKDAKSILANAAEELTFAHSEKAESKNLSERKTETQSDIGLLKIEEITAYLEAMHKEDGQARLEDTAKRILEGRRDGASPREEARRSFDDVTEQFVALNFAARKGEESGAGIERLDAIHESIAELDEDFGPRIRAGLNSVAGTRDFAGSAESAERFRDTYRDVVLGQEGLLATLNEVLERHGIDEFPRVVPALIKALGEDLSAMRPSRDPERVQAILQDLYNLEVAVTVHDQAKEISGSLERQFGAQPFEPLGLMKDVIGLTGERWVSGSRFTSIAEGLGLRDSGPQIAFLTAAKGMVRDIPLKAFSDPETRQAVMNAAQDALDVAIEREESGG